MGLTSFDSSLILGRFYKDSEKVIKGALSNFVNRFPPFSGGPDYLTLGAGDVA